MPSVKARLGQSLIEISTFEEDTERAFDLILRTPADIEIAVRIRDYKYLPFENQFTIRSRSNYGLKTEIHKISEGCTNLMFYGFHKNYEVIKYAIINLDVFRKHYRLNTNGEVMIDSVHPVKMFNPGDNTEFLVFNYGVFPSTIIKDGDINIQFGLEKVHQSLIPFPRQ